MSYGPRYPSAADRKRRLRFGNLAEVDPIKVRGLEGDGIIPRPIGEVLAKARAEHKRTTTSIMITVGGEVRNLVPAE